MPRPLCCFVSSVESTAILHPPCSVGVVPIVLLTEASRIFNMDVVRGGPVCAGCLIKNSLLPYLRTSV